jgi:hypothetical protein
MLYWACFRNLAEIAKRARIAPSPPDTSLTLPTGEPVSYVS